jgi:shikimate kinase
MGAISIVNAVASGKGATLAVNLPTSAKVSIEEKRGTWQVFANGASVRSPLAIHTLDNSFRTLGEVMGRYSGVVRTKTAVPTGVGLKTSSSSSVAIALAVYSAFGKRAYDTEEVLKISAASSLRAGVSLTGAMDDAASCLSGGVNFTDNFAKMVLSSSRLGRSFPVLIRIPRVRSRRRLVARSNLKKFSKVAESIFSLGRDGRIWKAMTLNGLLFSSIYGYPSDGSIEAVATGALGASLSGTGPAVAAVFKDNRDLKRLAAKWGRGDAKLIRTETVDEGAKIGL